MVVTKEEQTFQLLQKSNAVLICLPSKPSTDAIAAGLGMLSVVEKLGKKCQIVAVNFQLPPNHSFLPKNEQITGELPALKKFIINLNITKTKVAELHYAMEGDQLKIFVTPVGGFFAAKDVSTSAGQYAFDLIIALDTADLEALGSIYENNADFFYHTPIINIDHSPANDDFGQVNLVNVTATSTSELVFELISEWGKLVNKKIAATGNGELQKNSTDAPTTTDAPENSLLDEYIATSLLAGMISKTRSFRLGSVTPRSLAIASHLISQGARREEIVKHLYQSKRVATLKLWGRVLSKLQVDAEHKIVWTVLSADDAAVANGNLAEDLPDVIDELIVNAPEARQVFILYPGAAIQGSAEKNEKNGTASTCGIISVARYLNAKELFAELEPKGSEHFITFSTSQPIEKIANLIKTKLQQVVARTR